MREENQSYKIIITPPIVFTALKKDKDLLYLINFPNINLLAPFDLKEHVQHNRYIEMKKLGLNESQFESNLNDIYQKINFLGASAYRQELDNAFTLVRDFNSIHYAALFLKTNADAIWIDFSNENLFKKDLVCYTSNKIFQKFTSAVNLFVLQNQQTQQYSHEAHEAPDISVLDENKQKSSTAESDDLTKSPKALLKLSVLKYLIDEGLEEVVITDKGGRQVNRAKYDSIPKPSFATRVLEIEITEYEENLNQPRITKLELRKYNAEGALVKQDQSIALQYPYVRYSLLDMYIGKNCEWPKDMYYDVEELKINLDKTKKGETLTKRDEVDDTETKIEPYFFQEEFILTPDFLGITKDKIEEMLTYRSKIDELHEKDIKSEFKLLKDDFNLHETYLIFDILLSNQKTTRIFKLKAFFDKRRLLAHDVWNLL